MARIAFTCGLVNGQPVTSNTADPLNASTTAASQADVEAQVVVLEADAFTSHTTEQAAVETAVGVLETDGASPTQAHVNDLRAAWDALVTVLTTNGTEQSTVLTDVGDLRTVWDLLVADISPVPADADVVVSVNASNVTTRSAARRAIRAIELQMEGSGSLDP